MRAHTAQPLRFLPSRKQGGPSEWGTLVRGQEDTVGTPWGLTATQQRKGSDFRSTCRPRPPQGSANSPHCHLPRWVVTPAVSPDLYLLPSLARFT